MEIGCSPDSRSARQHLDQLPFHSLNGQDGRFSLTIGLNYGLYNNTGTAYVTVTPTNGAPAQTITVFYTQNSSCGGNTGNPSNNFITLSPGNLTLTAATNGSQSITVTVQDISGGPYGFTPTVSPSNSWLSVSAASLTLNPGGTTTLTVTADATKTSGVGSYTGSLTVTPATNYQGTTINIPVNFTVTNGTSSGGGGGSNNGTLTINGATDTTYTTAFNYTAPVAPGGTCVNIQDSAAGANGYSWQVSTSTGGNWLLANNQPSGSTITQLYTRDCLREPVALEPTQHPVKRRLSGTGAAYLFERIAGDD